ncbi:DUF4922 domain-containing protein [Bacteroidia bacterium]|nr:DUF4922 domain-containing protein [Bacteroidia bacterium]
MNDEIQQLFDDQLASWELAATNYAALSQVKTKVFDVGGYTYKVQFNPARIISSAAEVDAQSIRERKCFLCAANRPPEQKGILYNGRYEILVNPYPIFPRHLTIPALVHTPQLIIDHFGAMLDLAQQMSDYVIFYNGPKCGASAPDHFHFQAGSKGFLPLEIDPDPEFPRTILYATDSRQLAIDRFQYVYGKMSLHSDDVEPKMNVLVWFEAGLWMVGVVLRRKHRPACYYAEGDANILISPAAVDMGGVFITPLAKDFEKITVDDIMAILDEV